MEACRSRATDRQRTDTIGRRGRSTAIRYTSSGPAPAIDHLEDPAALVEAADRSDRVLHEAAAGCRPPNGCRRVAGSRCDRPSRRSAGDGPRERRARAQGSPRPGRDRRRRPRPGPSCAGSRRGAAGCRARSTPGDRPGCRARRPWAPSGRGPGRWRCDGRSGRRSRPGSGASGPCPRGGSRASRSRRRARVPLPAPGGPRRTTAS